MSETRRRTGLASPAASLADSTGHPLDDRLTGGPLRLVIEPQAVNAGKQTAQ